MTEYSNAARVKIAKLVKLIKVTHLSNLKYKDAYHALVFTVTIAADSFVFNTFVRYIFSVS